MSLYSFSDEDKAGSSTGTGTCRCAGTCSDCRYKSMQQNPYGNALPFSLHRPGSQPMPAPHAFPPEAALWRGTGSQVDPGLLFHRVADPTRMGRPAIGVPMPKDPAAWVYPDFAGASLYPPSCNF